MLVHKFGGASVQDATGIKNLGEIVGNETGKLIVVVSALGKTTNSLESVVSSFLDNNFTYVNQIDSLEEYHKGIMDELTGSKEDARLLTDDFTELREFMSNTSNRDYDYIYDQVVSHGEIWSTKIVDRWLNSIGLSSEWIDIRKSLITDTRYRDANVDWEKTTEKLKRTITKVSARITVVQGFIGATSNGDSTTLGREGSDFSAAIVANILDAKSVTVWKDVPGVLNADPKWLPETLKLDNISYKEAVEMSFSGAKVIHPKTIKPLHNKAIPLYVRSFADADNPGTVISVDKSIAQKIPLFVKKEDQVLLSFIPKDFSFVIGDNLGLLFQTFYRFGIKTNLVQASAVSIAVCVDNEKERLRSLIKALENDYKILVNHSAEIITLRYYTEDAIDNITSGREILLEQRTRRSIRFVVKKIEA